MPPGGLALVEKCLDAFASFGRRARFGDAANGQRLERVIDRATRDLGDQPFRARLRVWAAGEQRRNHLLDCFVEAGLCNDFVHETRSAPVRGGKRLPGQEVAASRSGADGCENVRLIVEGTRPIRTSEIENIASSAATAISQAATSPMPAA